MGLLGKAFWFGVLVWLIPFVVAVGISPVRESWRALFESIMPVVVAITVVVFALLYFRKVEANFVRTGFAIGLLWLLISIGIDLPLMLSPPVEMSFVEYMADIGLTYVIIPTITIGIGTAFAASPQRAGAQP